MAQRPVAAIAASSRADESDGYDPIETVAAFMASQKWPHQRDEREVQSGIKGSAACYSLSYVWYPEKVLLGCTCGFGYQPPKGRVARVGELILIINECLPIGHFEYRSEYEAVIHRSELITPTGEVSDGQVYSMLQAALSACDSYYAGFYLLLGGMAPREAFETGMRFAHPEGSA